MRSALERFTTKTRKAASGCTEWIGAVSNTGYGQFWIGGKMISAHRAALLLSGAEIPQGMDVDHICRNRRCVCVDHLRVVSRRINSIENARGFAAVNAAKLHCRNGHALTPENTKIEKRTNYTSRTCKTCARASDMRRRPERYADSLLKELAK